MIAVTSNSLARNSTLPALPNAVECAFLEAETGADFLISIAPYPIRTPALLQRHIDARAILVQHKSGLDLLASLGERLDSEIARMCGVAHRQCQRVLLTTGTFTHANGEVLLNRHATGIKWAQYIGALEKWTARGGVVSNLPSDSDIPAWCALKLAHLQEFKDAPVKHVYSRERFPDAPPMQDDPLQLPVLVRDARNTLISIPSVGPNLVEYLWGVSGGSVGLCLYYLTHPSAWQTLEGRPRNYGMALVEKCRAYFELRTQDTAYAYLGELWAESGERDEVK